MMYFFPGKYPRLALGILVFGLVLRLAVLGIFLAYDPGFIHDDDSAGYLELASNIENNLGFSWTLDGSFTPDSFRTPGYPFFLMVHHTLFGSYVSAIVTQILLSVLIAYLIMRLGAKYLSEEAGLIGALLFLIMPFSLLVTVRYLTQVTFTATVMLGVWFWVRYLDTSHKKFLILTAICLPIAALIRPIAIWIVAPFIAAALLSYFWKKSSLKEVAVSSLILISIFVAGLVPWLYRNYQVFGTASLSSLPAFQLYFYDDPAIYATAHGVSYDQAKIDLNTRIEKVTGLNYQTHVVDYSEFSSITPALVTEGVKVAFEDPLAFVKTRASQVFKFFVRDGIRYWIERYGIDTARGVGFMYVVIERMILFSITVGFVWVAVQAFRQRSRAVISMLLVTLYFAALTGVMASAGLRFPAEPIFLLLGSAGLIELYTMALSRFGAKKI